MDVGVPGKYSPQPIEIASVYCLNVGIYVDANRIRTDRRMGRSTPAASCFALLLDGWHRISMYRLWIARG